MDSDNGLELIFRLCGLLKFIDRLTLLSRIFNSGIIIDNGCKRFLEINSMFILIVPKMNGLKLFKVIK
ncbi:Uncharacterised protein [Sphingobacterium mizutaii]|uniref:Uncharacterized protein n=1 Tax=Sphingobacterium mizutaii TaxID=1010 RepID=A0AAJ4XAR5_9SPHI|nr:hypothetical protein SAMN05192578_101513 [Sphingobacterium mizutaii]SNV48844.1 Uncharacterised protein [Sphingobacterium mizutaii]